jgi:murein DD-endopeptidase
MTEDPRKVARHLVLILATIAPIMAGQSYAQPQEAPGLATGRQLTALAYAGESEELWKRMEDGMRALVQSAENLDIMLERSTQMLGDEIEVVEETTAKRNGLHTYTRRARFANAGDELFEVVFVTDDAGMISGFTIRPSQGEGPAPAPAGSDEAGEALALHEGIRTLVPIAPTAVSISDHHVLVYELRVVNRREEPVQIKAVQVVAGSTERPLLTLQADTLAAAYGGSSEAPELAPGFEVILYMWITLPDSQAVPSSLRHRLDVGIAGSVLSVNGPKVEPRSRAAIVVGAPLRGGNWLAGNGPDNASIHRRARIEVEGKHKIAQRFAIDFVRLRGTATVEADPADNASYFAYGADVLAVADGIVVMTQDGIPENIPGLSSRAVEVTLDNAAGNYVILDLGEGQYAFYAHLQPGSLRVARGDRVSRGDVLGVIGNSGNSTEPHLHFHVSDAPSPLGSEGLPYVFDRYLLQGTTTVPTAQIDDPSTATTIERQLPLGNEVIDFGDTTSPEPD